MKVYLGLDLGAVSTNLALLDEREQVIDHRYLRTRGEPIASVKNILESAAGRAATLEVAACGTTGSGRHLAAALLGADVVRNEISSHATAALHFFPQAKTIIEIGGQDSKIIIIRDGVASDFAMNTVCAAGTGSFLDYQASRMGITIEELARLAGEAREGIRISGRCAVFAETDLVEKQQQGADRKAVLRGLCDSLARNFLASVARGKPVLPPIVFQGGVASNRAVVSAFERELGTAIEVPQYHDVMGAIGVAMLAAREAGPEPSKFRGFAVRGERLTSRMFECTGCSNGCEVTEILDSGNLVSRWGSRCGKWDMAE